jgi:hypothetical protein
MMPAPILTLRQRPVKSERLFEKDGRDCATAIRTGPQIAFAGTWLIGTAPCLFSQAPLPVTDRVDEGDSLPLDAIFI